MTTEGEVRGGEYSLIGFTVKLIWRSQVMVGCRDELGKQSVKLDEVRDR